MISINVLNEGAVSFESTSLSNCNTQSGLGGGGAVGPCHTEREVECRERNILGRKQRDSLMTWVDFDVTDRGSGKVDTVLLVIVVAQPSQTIPAHDGRRQTPPKQELLNNTQIYASTERKIKRNSSRRSHWLVGVWRNQGVRTDHNLCNRKTQRQALPSTVTWCHERVSSSGRKLLTSVKTPRLSGSCWKSRGTVHSDAPSHYKATMDTITQVKKRIFAVNVGGKHNRLLYLGKQCLRTFVSFA